MISLVDKTLEAYEKHGNIIVGVDFDDTILPSDNMDEESVDRCNEVVAQLKDLIYKYD